MNELAPCPSQPCQTIPHGLVSLWDMLKFNAHHFIHVMNFLSDIERTPTSARSTSFFFGENREHFAAVLSGLCRQLAELNLPASFDKLNEIKFKLGDARIKEDDKPLSYQLMQQDIKELRGRMESELKGRHFFAVLNNVDLLLVQDGFGPEVDQAFPSASYDATEAGKCLALTRSTASVMHIMRVLEVGLTALAHDLGLKPRSDNWHTIIRDVQDEIGARNKGTHGAAWKDVDEPFYSEAVAHFRVLKNAWRNHSVHAKAKYTESEAGEIYQGARSFMRHLSERLCEPGP